MWNGAFQTGLQFNKGNFKLSTKISENEKMGFYICKITWEKNCETVQRALHGYYTVL